jgi:hypothetical protein
MNAKVALLAVVVLSLSLMTNAYAHKAQVVGDYKIEVGWKNEPPIVGKKNAIEILVTKATSSDKKSSNHDHDSHDHDAKKTKTTKTSYDESSSNIKLVSTSKDKEHKHDTKTTKSTKKSAGMTGLSKTLEADVTLNGKKSFLKLVEDKQHKGTYHGTYTPNSVGYPTVHVVGKIKNTPVEITFHPEKVEASK